MSETCKVLFLKDFQFGEQLIKKGEVMHVPAIFAVELVRQNVASIIERIITSNPEEFYNNIERR